jgi:hypothetical protein
MDNVVAVVAAAAVLALAVIAVPIVAAVRMVQVVVTKNGLAMGIPVLLDLSLIATIWSPNITKPKPFCSVSAEGFGPLDAWNKRSSEFA